MGLRIIFNSDSAVRELLRESDSSICMATHYGLAVTELNPGRGEIFLTPPDRPCGPPSHLYKGYRFFSGGKAAGSWSWPPTPI